MFSPLLAILTTIGAVAGFRNGRVALPVVLNLRMSDQVTKQAMKINMLQRLSGLDV